MRRKRCKAADQAVNKPYLYLTLAILLTFLVTLNCSFGFGTNNSVTTDTSGQSLVGTTSGNHSEQLSASVDPQAAVLAEQLWADATETTPSTPRPGQGSGSTISLDVRDANILDVLSLLAYKIGVNIIYLEQPLQITFKSESLSPITTLKLILQNQGFDYLVVGRNYVVAQRVRLFSNFSENLLLTRYGLFYVSASSMQGYLTELGVDTVSPVVDSNQQAIWLQGTPMTLGMAREVINALDVMENADFAEGGLRKIRMPVAMAVGPQAEDELAALVDLLSILLDGFRDGRIENDWFDWDHPDPIPSITMNWESPVIKPYDIKMKITRDLAPGSDGGVQVRYLIAEGTPDNIILVENMIEKIQFVNINRASPISLPSETVVFSLPESSLPPQPTTIPQGGSVQTYSVTLNAVPGEGGSLSGAGSYSSGTWVTITATPAEGYDFVRWIEAGYELSTNTSYSFTLSKNRMLEAVFISSGSEEE